jgi:hypothetical protein
MIGFPLENQQRFPWLAPKDIGKFAAKRTMEGAASSVSSS